jgi:putative NADH-flavin reductase
MKLAIFGASGATGKRVVQQALKNGHTVTVLLRNHDGLAIEDGRIQRVVGTLDDPAAVAKVIEGADVVISVLGIRKGGSQEVCATGIRSILKPMQPHGTQRLVALSAYGASETRNDAWFIRLIRKLISAKMRDKDHMEDLIRSSAVDWTLIRPPALTNGPATGSYRHGIDLRPGLTARLSRADLASFIVDVCEGGKYHREAPVVSLR